MNHEFVLPSDDGETEFTECGSCGYAANLEISDAEGERCPVCGSESTGRRGIELGHVFQIGSKYSEVMEAQFLDRSGKSAVYQMGCYGLGISRMVAAMVDSHRDEVGMKWPRALAPYEVVVLVLSEDPMAREGAVKLYEELKDGGVSALLDDRDVSAGVKFADADLIGYPIQVIVGREFSAGRVEIRSRASRETMLGAPTVQSIRDALSTSP